MTTVTTSAPTAEQRAAAAKAAVEKAQKNAPKSLMGGMGYSILNAGGSLLDAGRRINRSGIGMSANSRALLEGFYNNASAIFNQLYTKAENGEAANQMQILALRSKYSYLAKGGVFDDDAKTAAASTTTGTNVDKTA